MAESELYRKGREIRRQELTEVLLHMSGHVGVPVIRESLLRPRASSAVLDGAPLAGAESRAWIWR